MTDIFISHINEEKNIAIVLKDWIESTFSGQFKVFVSSDNHSIIAGDKWMNNIYEALTCSKVLIALCSKSSIQRPWINFEIGGAWTKNIPIIPICHSGISKNSLPQPIAQFHALNLDDKESLTLIFKSIAKHLDINRLPRIDYSIMKKEIENALQDIEINSTSLTKQYFEINEKNKTFRTVSIPNETKLFKKDELFSNQEIIDFIKVTKDYMIKNGLSSLDKIKDDNEFKVYLKSSPSMHKYLIQFNDYYNLSRILMNENLDEVNTLIKV